MAEMEGALVKTGHEEGLKMAASLEEFGLPLGLLPLADVVEVGFVKGTGYITKNIKKLKGVKAKELMLWPPVSQIIVDDPPTGKVHFKSLAGITKTFPVEAFDAGQ
ncbi:hypothetical protein POTOM_016955 [Populus tomentosa]|uniref:Uncharacterized protein n=1 Tax=Populus tomentosa TaxID=118781 RepID=A0A8X7ZWP4_POPTO|nr:hypothetical protein POTOM_016955 [Populus tomentosa]